MKDLTIDFKKKFFGYSLEYEKKVYASNLELNRCWRTIVRRDRGCFCYKTTLSYLRLMTCGAITTELEKQNDAFRAIITQQRKISSVTLSWNRFAGAIRGKILCVNSTVPLFVQSYNVRINRSISANERAKARKQGKEKKYLR